LDFLHQDCYREVELVWEGKKAQHRSGNSRDGIEREELAAEEIFKGIEDEDHGRNFQGRGSGHR